MKDRKKMIEDTDEDIEKLFKKDVTIDLIKDSLKDIGLLRMNAIRSLIYNNLVDEEIIAKLKDIAINGTKFKFFCYTESDFATVALHILGYKEIPLTEWGEKILKAKDDVFTKWD